MVYLVKKQFRKIAFENYFLNFVKKKVCLKPKMLLTCF